MYTINGIDNFEGVVHCNGWAYQVLMSFHYTAEKDVYSVDNIILKDIYLQVLKYDKDGKKNEIENPSEDLKKEIEIEVKKYIKRKLSMYRGKSTLSESFITAQSYVYEFEAEYEYSFITTSPNSIEDICINISRLRVTDEEGKTLRKSDISFAMRERIARRLTFYICQQFDEGELKAETIL